MNRNGMKFPGALSPANRRGATMVEVAVTVAIVSFTGISIIGALAFGAHQKQAIRERNGALRAAADTMETVKRTHFSDLNSRTIEDVVLVPRDDGRDDITGDVSLRFFLMDDTEVGTPANPIPLDLSMVRVEVAVTWTPIARSSGDQQVERLVTLLAP